VADVKTALAAAPVKRLALQNTQDLVEASVAALGHPIVRPPHLLPLHAEHLQPQQSAADHPRPRRDQTAAAVGATAAVALVAAMARQAIHPTAVAPPQAQLPKVAVPQQQWTQGLGTRAAVWPVVRVKPVESPTAPLRAEKQTPA